MIQTKNEVIYDPIEMKLGVVYGEVIGIAITKDGYNASTAEYVIENDVKTPLKGMVKNLFIGKDTIAILESEISATDSIDKAYKVAELAYLNENNTKTLRGVEWISNL